MGSGVSVPADSRQVADLLEHLPADELAAAGLTPTKSTTSTALDVDGVPHQIKEKVARMVASAIANSPDDGRLEMNSQVLEYDRSCAQVCLGITLGFGRDSCIGT
jgi:hypothetical protein